MARDERKPLSILERIATRATPTMLAALGAVGLAFALSAGRASDSPTEETSESSILTGPRVALLVAGLCLAATAVLIRYRHTRWDDLESRLMTAGTMALGGLAALIAFWGMNAEWDSARMVVTVLVVIALAGGLLVILPQGWRRAMVSLLVAIHFGGIMTAVTSEPTSNGSSAWVSTQLRTRVYRPYLESIYQTNPYHFYSPDPGAPFLLWFYIEYEDGTVFKLDVPRRESFATRLEFQRRLALTDRATTGDLSPPSEEMAKQRHNASFAFVPPLLPHPTIHANGQFRRPGPASKRFLSSYVRHIAQTYHSEQDPSKTPRRIKIYCVIHGIISATQLELGLEPTDPTMYTPFYFGTYNKNGKLLNPDDPLLYWMIPIYRKVKEGIDLNGREPKLEEMEIHNSLEQHAAFSK